MNILKNITRFLKDTPWLALILAMVAVLLSEVGGGILDEILKSLAHISIWLKLMIIVSIIFFLVVWLYHLRNTFFPFRTLSRHPCEGHEGLVLLLSDSNILVDIKSFPLTIKNSAGQQAVLAGESLEEDIKALNLLTKPWWNWQQLLRGLAPHQKTLKIVYLIGSKDTKDEKGEVIKKGSGKDIDNAAKLVHKYFLEAEIKKLEEAVDFEDLDEIVKYVNKCIAYIRKMEIEEKDIIIDVTGGMKTTSIAGAIVTMNRKATTFQYVQTIPPYKTVAYDLKILPGLPEGG